MNNRSLVSTETATAIGTVHDEIWRDAISWTGQDEWVTGSSRRELSAGKDLRCNEKSLPTTDVRMEELSEGNECRHRTDFGIERLC